MSLTVVTTAHNDPYHFSLLESYVRRMTKQPDVWLVVNDSDKEYRDQYKYNMGQQVVYRDDRSPINGNNASWCMVCALDLIKTDHVAIMEHDDWYSVDYLRRVENKLADFPLMGFSHDCYYHVPSRSFKYMPNESHASLAATAFHKDVLPAIHFIAATGDVYIDGCLWGGYNGPCFLVNNIKPDGTLYHLGIKGHVGITPHHREPVNYTTDPYGKQLTNWIGAESENYLASI